MGVRAAGNDGQSAIGQDRGQARGVVLDLVGVVSELGLQRLAQADRLRGYDLSNFLFLISSRARIMPPRGPRRVFVVVQVTISACGIGDTTISRVSSEVRGPQTVTLEVLVHQKLRTRNCSTNPITLATSVSAISAQLACKAALRKPGSVFATPFCPPTLTPSDFRALITWVRGVFSEISRPFNRAHRFNESSSAAATNTAATSFRESRSAIFASCRRSLITSPVILVSSSAISPAFKVLQRMHQYGAK